MKLPKLTEGLLRMGDLIKQNMVVTLNKQLSDKATGALARSIQYEVVQNDSSFGLQRSMLTYGNYVDSGVKGTENKKGIPSDKSLFPIGQFTHKVINQSSGLPFPVRMTIARDGLKPKPFIVSSIDSTMEQQGKEILGEASAKSAQEIVKENLEATVKVEA
tara:strand:- start:1021 stop:1503 length:483 start_codon:yes stop_codon:yes gene_type:complete